MYASVSCSFPTFSVCICVLPLPSCEFTFVSPPRDRTFLCRCPVFALVGLLFCSATLLFVFYFYWSISFPSSLFTMFRFLFQSPTKEPVVWFICLLIGLFRIDFGIGGPLAFAATFSARGPETSPRKRMGFVFSFWIAFSFLFFSFSPHRLTCAYFTSRLFSIHFTLPNFLPGVFFPGLSFFPLRLYRLVYAFTRAVKRLLFPFSRLLL